MPTADRPDPRTTLTARTVRDRSGPVHVVTTLPTVRTPVIGRVAVRNVGHAGPPPVPAVTRTGLAAGPSA
jgi:hypothetical protein